MVSYKREAWLVEGEGGGSWTTKGLLGESRTGYMTSLLSFLRARRVEGDGERIVLLAGLEM